MMEQPKPSVERVSSIVNIDMYTSDKMYHRTQLQDG